VPETDADRSRCGGLITTGVVAEESESPAGPEPDTELSRLNNPITEFFCLGLAIPPTLTHKGGDWVKLCVAVVLKGDQGKVRQAITIKSKERKEEKTKKKKL
jgi:hypothetical protein